MAIEELTPSFSNFSIEDTMEMGTGNQELLNDLFSPETATANPDDIKEIIKEIPGDKNNTEKSSEEESAQQDLLASFLSKEEEGEETVSEDNISTEKPKDTSEEQVEFNPYSAFSKDLFKLGAFTKEDDNEEDEEISTPEAFLERFNTEKRKGAIDIVNNFIGKFGEDYQNAFEAIFVKGVDPKDYFSTYNNIVNFAELDLANEDNQIKVIKQALSDQGFEPEDVTTEIERLKNYGDLESVAMKHHKVLVKKEAIKLHELEQRADQETQQKTLIRNQYIQNVQQIIQEKLKTKEFDGIPINPKLADELQDFLLVDKYKTVSGESLTDFDKYILEMKRPENHATKVKLGLLLTIMKKDPTLSTIQKSGLSKRSDQLFTTVARQKTAPVITQSKSWFS